MKWIVQFVISLLCLYRDFVHGHNVISLLQYAESICKPDPKVESFWESIDAPLKPSLVQEMTTRKCKYELLGIITKNEELGDVDSMAFILGYVFGESDIEEGIALAEKIHEKCSKIQSQVKGKSVEEWKPFFECVSKIIPIDSALSGRLFSYLAKGPGQKEEDERLKKLVLPKEEIDQIRPKLYCHKGYENSTKEYSRGEGLRQYAYKVCKHHKKEQSCQRCQHHYCTYECMHELFGFIERGQRGRYVFPDRRDDTIGRFSIYFQKSNSRAYAKELVDKVFAECKDKKGELRHGATRNPCDTRPWESYLKCVEPILASY